jgi:hypothetical protein
MSYDDPAAKTAVSHNSADNELLLSYPYQQRRLKCGVPNGTLLS